MDDPQLPPIEQAVAAIKRQQALPPIDEAVRKLRAQSSDGPTDPDATYHGGKAGSFVVGAAGSVPFANKILAGLSAASGALPDWLPGQGGVEHGGTFGERYEHAKARLKAGESAAESDNPWTARAGGLAGGLATVALTPEIKGVGLLARAAKSTMGQGALYGALQGASEAEGDVGDYAAKIGRGAAFGGATAPVIGGLARPFVKYGALAAEKAAPYVPEAVRRGASSVADALTLPQAPAAADVLTATGKNRRALSGLTSEIERSGKTIPDVAAQVDQATVHGSGREMIAQAARDLKAIGDQFPVEYAAGAKVPDDVMQAWLQKGGRSLWQKAQADAARLGRELPTKSAGAGMYSNDQLATLMNIKDLGERRAAAEAMSAGGDIPIPDVEALHFMRKAAAADPKFKPQYEFLKGAVEQHAPGLDAAIDAYATQAHKYEVLVGGKDAPNYFSATSQSTPDLALKSTDPRRLAESLTGPPGLAQAFANLTPEEQRLWRTTAQEHAGELLQSGQKLGDATEKVKNPWSDRIWQPTVFGSPEAYKAFELGQTAQPAPGIRGGLKDFLDGYIPHSQRGYMIKGAQTLARLARGRPSMTSDVPLSAQSVLEQALSRQRGMGTVDALRNALTLRLLGQ